MAGKLIDMATNILLRKLNKTRMGRSCDADFLSTLLINGCPTTNLCINRTVNMLAANHINRLSQVKLRLAR
jgi:hypothetical protein